MIYKNIKTFPTNLLAMRFVSVILVMLLFSLGACADVGPSPNYSFSISNASDYQNYAFYYAGTVFDGLYIAAPPGGEKVTVYKFNTQITIYAIPRQVIAEPGEPLNTNALISMPQSIASQAVQLQSGHTVFRVASFDTEAKSMSLEIVSQTPDPDYPVEVLVSYLPALLFLLVPLAVVVVAIFAVKPLVAKLRPKK